MSESPHKKIGCQRSHTEVWKGVNLWDFCLFLHILHLAFNSYLRQKSGYNVVQEPCFSVYFTLELVRSMRPLAEYTKFSPFFSKQPADKGRGRTDFTFIMPLAPWSHALAMFLNLSLLARVLHTAWIELILWICLGNTLIFVWSMRIAMLFRLVLGMGKFVYISHLGFASCP